MSIRQLLPALVFAAAAAALAAPLVLGDQKPDGSRTRYANAWTTGDHTVPPGSTGWGKGCISMPVGDQLGLIVGPVLRSDCQARYYLQGQLTGCIPSDGLAGGAQFWFGGLYGKLQQIVESEPDPGRDEVPWFVVEGTWVLDKDYEGSFVAQLLGRNEAGTQYVCGLVVGRFEVSEAMPGPGRGGSQPMSFKLLDDRRPIDKAKLSDVPGLDGRTEGGTITCPKAAGQVDVAGPPKTEGQPCSTGWRDVRSTVPPLGAHEVPNRPVLMGSFDLRYQLYE